MTRPILKVTRLLGIRTPRGAKAGKRPLRRTIRHPVPSLIRITRADLPF